MTRVSAAAAVILGLVLLAGPVEAQGRFDFEVAPPAPTPAPLPAGAVAKSVQLTRILFEMQPGERWVRIDAAAVIGRESRYLTWTGSAGPASAAGFDQVFAEELHAAGFKSATADLFGDGAGTDLQVGAIVKDLRVRVCVNCWAGERSGAVFKAEWQLYDPLERRVVATFASSGTASSRDGADGAVEKIIFAAYRDSVRRLIGSDEFRQALLEPRSDATSAPASVTSLTPISFAPAPGGRRAIAEAAAAVATIHATSGHGSAFLVSRDGYLLTNQHVVGDSRFVKVRWSDGSEVLGEVVRADRGRDVALVKAAAGARAPLALRTSAVQPGEPAIAVGTPLDEKFQATVTRGVVSATRVDRGRPFIQSDVTVNRGNSGGPLLDEAGAVIGITVLGYQPEGIPTGINLFIPIGDALEKLALKPAS